MTADINLDPCLPGNRVFTTAVIAPDTNSANGFQGTLFTGVFDGAGHKILNLTINTNGAGNDYLGLFGDVNRGEIKNLGLESVKISSGTYSYYVGGLAGDNWASISNCYSTVSILGGNFSYYLGGLVGSNSNSGASISNCYSTGDINTGTYSSSVGGLVGENGNSGGISDSHSTCNVTGAHDSSEFGGLAGRNLGTINNCFSKGTVTGNGLTYGVGGLVGSGYNGGYVINSFSTSNVRGGNNSFNIGGLAGGSDGVITGCFSTGSVTGGDYIQVFGGLVGMVGFGNISNCYSTSPVTGGVWAFNIGGFAGALGEMSEPVISDCYSTGDVNVGNDSSSLGGFIGQCQGDISNCYSKGNVHRASGEYEMGGFAGSINFGGDIIGSYFLDTAGPYNGYGIPLSDTQMKQQASFVGWDFTNTWRMRCEGINYPKLNWQAIPAADWVCPDGVNFVDYSFFAERWMNTNCTANNNCDGTDLDFSGTVDIADLKIFCNYWLQGL